MDGVEALRHLREWLGKEAGLPLELLTGLEKVLAEEQVFQVEDLMLLRDGARRYAGYGVLQVRDEAQGRERARQVRATGEWAASERAACEQWVGGWRAGTVAGSGRR